MGADVEQQQRQSLRIAASATATALNHIQHANIDEVADSPACTTARHRRCSATAIGRAAQQRGITSYIQNSVSFSLILAESCDPTVVCH
jgi:hypothetical protein